ncbi:hypothetical protein [Saccharopolyspora shandongensis]|uniref:hypothetical protein n=1 Tax=Saccharopolyspora shandongensis TaxID=418495 RepID=UPI0034092C3D
MVVDQVRPGDVHAGNARCGHAGGASRFLTGLAARLAPHVGIPATRWAAEAVALGYLTQRPAVQAGGEGTS